MPDTIEETADIAVEAATDLAATAAAALENLDPEATRRLGVTIIKLLIAVIVIGAIAAVIKNKMGGGDSASTPGEAAEAAG